MDAFIGCGKQCMCVCVRVCVNYVYNIVYYTSLYRKNNVSLVFGGLKL